MLRLVEDFRQRPADAMAATLDHRHQMRGTMHALRREVDHLRTYRAEAGRRMMRHGIEPPEGIT
ncbi:hypothetical protein [Methylobacterium nonmethylotrophicum]|uniref:Uncharacterized protein n=1 Tax=Methylobacterium nonmethylotrophicum TaxID=1141884 RepID=A0A4Z0NFE2_9HYPH|nr:hypothetical protein [Methylobacterium nonmethylotrophicum]TGD93432.1 hypothetical protein EU555_33365 [Methylobacterium nonmethylotrophicum]